MNQERTLTMKTTSCIAISSRSVVVRFAAVSCVASWIAIAGCGSSSGNSVTCGIETDYFYEGLTSCELSGFAGASATLAPGETATVGVSCCGSCGCVAVEVRYDGTKCWDGGPPRSVSPAATRPATVQVGLAASQTAAPSRRPAERRPSPEAGVSVSRLCSPTV